jgi:Tfp pilus assembly protein FimT
MASRTHDRIRSNRAGFSMLEIMTVTAISLIITVMSMPNMINAMGSMRLRSSMTSLAGVLQNCRMLSVKQNQTMSTHFLVTNYGTSNGVLAYVDKASAPVSSSISSSDSQVQLEQPVTRVTTLSGPGAPSTALDSTILGFTPQTGDPSFTSTGLPCAYSSGNCANAGFLYYFHDTRSAGHTGWAALSISPAGRLKAWYWSGSAWIS